MTDPQWSAEDVFTVTPRPGLVRLRINTTGFEIDLTADAAYWLAFELADGSGRVTRGEVA